MTTFKTTRVFSAPAATVFAAFEAPIRLANIRHIVEPANEQNLNRWEAEVKAGEGGGA